MEARRSPDRHRNGHSARPRLLDAIDDGLSAHRLVLIHAAAGAGKTVLLDQWVARRCHQQPDERIVRIAGDQPVADADAMVQGWMADRPTVLVVDDADRLAPSVLGHLDRLLDDGSAGLQMVLAARTRPALSLSRLGLDGHVAHLDTADLALRIEELTDLVIHLTGTLSTIDRCLWLLHETEGWVAGVKLLVSTSLASEDGEALPDRPADLRSVTDYVDEQLLGALPDDLRHFLLTTSVLDRLDAGVCEAVTGATGGQRWLEELERRNLFLIPLDDRRVAYRYHHMFADVLRHRFRTDDPDGWRDALVRAAEWYLTAGDLHRGIDLLVKAGAWAAVVEAVTMHQFELVGSGAGRSAVEWLTAVPKAVLERDPRAVWVLGLFHRINGDVADAEAVIVGLGHDAHDGRLDPDLYGRLVAGWKTSGLPWGTPPAEALESALAAESLLASVEGQLQRSGNLPKYRHYRTQLVGNRTAAAEALLHLGRIEEAARWAARAVDVAGHDPLLRAAALGTSAYIDARSGNLVAAVAAAEESRDLSGAATFHRVAIEPEFALIEVAYATDDLDRADLMLAGVEEQARSMQASTRVGQVAIVRAAVALGRGAFRDGLSVLAEHRRERWPALPNGIEVRFRVLEACLTIFLGDVAGGRRKLRSSGLTLRRAPGAFLTLAAVERDRASMRIIVDSWPEPLNLRAQAQYLAARSLLADLDGDTVDRRRHLEALASLVVPERFVRPVVDLAPSVSPLISQVAASGGSPDLLLLRDLAEAATRSDARRPASRLSPREQAVLELLVTDLTNPEIADALEVSTNTLKTYLRRTYQKLGVSSRRDAVRRATELGLLKDRRPGR